MCDQHTKKKRDGKAQELKEEGKTKTIITTETIWNSIYTTLDLLKTKQSQ